MQNSLSKNQKAGREINCLVPQEYKLETCVFFLNIFIVKHFVCFLKNKKKQKKTVLAEASLSTVLVEQTGGWVADC